MNKNYYNILEVDSRGRLVDESTACTNFKAARKCAIDFRNTKLNARNKILLTKNQVLRTY